MAQGKKSFVAYADWKEIFDELPNEQAGELIKHIFSYVNDENPTTDSILIRAVFANIKSTLKRDLDRWESQLEQRRRAGKRSAEIRSTKTNEPSTVVESRKRNPTDSVSVSVNVNDNVNVNDINKNNREKTNRFVPPTLNEVQDYCSERMNSVSPQHFIDHYTSNGWMVGKNKMKDWRSAVRNWERTNKQFNLNQNGNTKSNDGSGLIAWVKGD